MDNLPQINPLWISLGVALIRTLLQLAGFGSFLLAHPDSPTQLVSAIVLIGSVIWMIVAKVMSHQQKVVLKDAALSGVAK